MRRLTFKILSSLFFVVALAIPALAEEVCFAPTAASTIKYKLGYEARSSTFDINGVVVYNSGARIPVSGSAVLKTDGTIIIGFTEIFPFADGGFGQPTGVTTLRFPNGNLNAGTRATTYLGSGTPSNTTENVAVVNCSTVAADGTGADKPGENNVK